MGSAPRLLLCLLLSAIPLAAQFADEDKRESRFLNDIKAGIGVSQPDTLLLNSMLEEAYVENGRFQLWTRKNIKQKLAREALKTFSSEDCQDTSCLVKQANCKGIDGELMARNGRVVLTVKLLSTEGTTLRSKMVADLDLDDFEKAKSLAKALFRFLEEGLDFDAGRFQKARRESAAPAVAGGQSCDLILQFSPAQVRKLKLEGTEVPVLVQDARRLVRLDRNRLILQKVPAGRVDVILDWYHEENRLTLSNMGLYLMANETARLPEEAGGELLLNVEKARVPVEVSANLAGVVLLLDDQPVGETPSWKGWAIPGTRVLSVQGANLAPFRTNWVVSPVRNAALQLSLSRQAPLSVALRNETLGATVEADLTLDGKALGRKSYWKGTLLEGAHVLVAEREGFVAVTNRFMSLDAPILQSIDLESSSAWLDLDIGPEPATVTIAGLTERGVAQKRLSGIPEGLHRLRIEHPDYAPVEETLLFARNKIARKQVALVHSEKYLKAQRLAILTGERKKHETTHRKAAVGLAWKFGVALGLASVGTILNLAADQNYSKAQTAYQTYSGALLSTDAVSARQTVTGYLSQVDLLSTVGDSTFIVGGLFLILGSFDLGTFRLSGTKIRELDQQINTADLQLSPSLRKDGAGLSLQARF